MPHPLHFRSRYVYLTAPVSLWLYSCFLFEWHESEYNFAWWESLRCKKKRFVMFASTLHKSQYLKAWTAAGLGEHLRDTVWLHPRQVEASYFDRWGCWHAAPRLGLWRQDKHLSSGVVAWHAFKVCTAKGLINLINFVQPQSRVFRLTEAVSQNEKCNSFSFGNDKQALPVWFLAKVVTKCKKFFHRFIVLQWHSNKAVLDAWFACLKRQRKFLNRKEFWYANLRLVPYACASAFRSILQLLLVRAEMFQHTMRVR